MPDQIDTYAIEHKEHGKAQCDDRMWAEFKKAGWTRDEKAAKERADKAKAEKDAGDEK